ncbi:MAG: RNA polymerase sigma-70 factor [Flavobacterium sp.]|uniref:RNA polymerase sigma-70 factor n=1 Tax=Flavobacterium sp. TaxID=239 RepID=UPI001B2759CB|nr:RNA polymerase sigma-70 factor [Flavobacterium sp.]MBO9585309.1 RNA polymerase sigma-70 factor [Flavobacterium sp.]
MNDELKHFKQLFYELYQPLCNYAHKYLQDRDESEDVVQELMIKIWETRQDLLYEKGLKFYLYTAVKNRCISILRKKIYMLDIDEMSADIAEEIPETKPLINPDQLVENAFNGIPPKCLEIFKLSRIEKLSYKQIAEKLEISVKTVENQMGKAIRHIREFVKKHPNLILLSKYWYFSHYMMGVLKEFVFYLKEV